MSASIIILKKIESFSYLDILAQVKTAAENANFHCIYVNTYFDSDNEFQDLDGTISEVNIDLFKENHQNGIHTRQCTFNIRRPTEFSYDSFSWLINKSDYYWALDLQDLGGDYEFALKFLSCYFQNNENDYLWFDDADWYYTANEIINIGKQTYNCDWVYRNIMR